MQRPIADTAAGVRIGFGLEQQAYNVCVTLVGGHVQWRQLHPIARFDGSARFQQALAELDCNSVGVAQRFVWLFFPGKHRLCFVC